ncbi:MAG TPA: tRNA (N(6)-L-threonylcarbamoyladenosine(37)-C(2))-methylthiotransferase MtaB [Nitrospirales bacterium]|nr:tRNA (N(6)-L-threonylcarbamoyladenosine(37)-C(2))-methylthiotransferase MtaB [Nitrospirales bacterium]
MPMNSEDFQQPQPRVTFYTLGCRLNQAETAVLKDGFQQSGFLPVEFGQETDVFVINTCTVTEGAEVDCRRIVRQVLRHSPHAFVAVTGCYAQTGLEVLRRMADIDLIVGNQFKMQLTEIIPPFSQLKKQPVPLVHHGRIDPENFLIEGVGAYTTTRANVKIQDGCQFMCSFCLIPFARGRERSRFLEDAVREAEELVERGHRELVLTGVNIGQYRDGAADLLVLLHRFEAIKGLERIRISSIEPTTVPESLLDYMSSSTKLCRYLHVPLQSGDDRILEAMNRRYSVREYSEAMESALKRIPDLCFGTDVLVGFPGEGSREFSNTEAVIRDLPFAYLHVFSYSPRPGTASTKLPHAVSPITTKERSRRLRELSDHKRMAFQQRFIGRRVSVLFEAAEAEGYWPGLTDNYIRVAVRSPHPLRNTIQPVVVTGIMSGTTLGLLEPSSEFSPTAKDLYSVSSLVSVS